MHTESETRTKRSLFSNYSLLLAVVFGGFLIFGFSENIKGPAIPRMQADFSLSEAQIGMLLALNSLGYLIACSFTAWLVKTIGIKLTTLLSFGSMVISGFCLYYSVNYSTMVLSYFFMYIGNGLLEIALAILAAQIFTRNTGTMMNLAHFFYGLSSIVAPLLAANLMGVHLFGASAELGWRGMYCLMLSLAILPMIPTILAKSPKKEEKHGERLSLKEYMKDKAAWLLVGVLSLGVVSELAIGSWLVNFLEKAYDWSSGESAGMLSAFFLCFTFARLVLGPVTDRIGYTLSLILLSAFSGLCSIAAVIAGEPGAFLFAVAGIGIAPIYPTVMALIAKRYPKESDTAITFTVTLMGIATVAGNYLIGLIIELFKNGFAEAAHPKAGLIAGLQAGYVFIGACALLCSVMSVWLYRHLKQRGALL
ncbi:MFS transporter [Paenibacillus glycanilyticus]|uniref:Major facilitator superfamily protein n=1 Tax=Paenibacillus glycanilyticus TaxID=126569 RepID=A0ABQ6G5G5_9BACL|nr:MFS transporter [Paenibacillus glycanilyticus]GLX65700.1 major facilitator superfamily protein [Paenibacillus glycanilyticus]